MEVRKIKHKLYSKGTKDKIIELFFEKHLKPVDIARKLDVKMPYITKIIQKDSRYIQEKEARKQDNKEKQKTQKRIYAQNKWENYKDNNGMAEYAIGGSTIEMWMDSWYKRYPNDRLYCNNTNKYGYYVGTSSNPSDFSITSSVMDEKDGYKNSTLYYPCKSPVSDGNRECDRYWLVSPSAINVDYIVTISCNGIQVNSDTNTLKSAGLRPVVSLNSEITVNATDAE